MMTLDSGLLFWATLYNVCQPIHDFRRQLKTHCFQSAFTAPWRPSRRYFQILTV